MGGPNPGQPQGRVVGGSGAIVSWWKGASAASWLATTRSGRHGQAWTWDGPINLKNARFAEDESPLDPTSKVSPSCDYSKAYLHHLVRANEILGQVLLSWHNVAFFQAMMAEMRAAISEGRMEAFRRDFAARQARASETSA